MPNNPEDLLTRRRDINTHVVLYLRWRSWRLAHRASPYGVPSWDGSGRLSGMAVSPYIAVPPLRNYMAGRVACDPSCVDRSTLIVHRFRSTGLGLQRWEFEISIGDLTLAHVVTSSTATTY